MTGAALRTRLAQEDLDPQTWSNGPGVEYGAHSHDYDKIIVVEAGTIAFGLVTLGERVDLAVGDRLEIPAGTVHEATVGPDGVSCLEAHQPAGRLAREPRCRWAGDW